MKSLFGRLGAGGRTTVPKEIRKALGVKPGDMLVYRIAKGRVTLARAEPLDRVYLKALESTLSEWNSDADTAAYEKLSPRGRH